MFIRCNIFTTICCWWWCDVWTKKVHGKSVSLEAQSVIWYLCKFHLILFVFNYLPKPIHIWTWSAKAKYIHKARGRARKKAILHFMTDHITHRTKCSSIQNHMSFLIYVRQIRRKVCHRKIGKRDNDWFNDPKIDFRNFLFIWAYRIRIIYCILLLIWFNRDCNLRTQTRNH